MIMRALDALLEDLDVVRWCRTRLKERCPFAERLALKRTWRDRTAHARRALEAIRRDDPEFSRELERTVVADAAPELAHRR